MTYTEPQIIAGLQQDDPAICRYLFETYYAPVRYFVNKIINNQEESEDIVMKAFQSFWSTRLNFSTVKSIQAFLYITAKNSSLNYLKHRKYQLSYAAGLNKSEQSDEDIERHYIESDFMRFVYQEINQLPGRCREIFIMTYLEDMTSGEIAKELGINVSTVTTQISRAKQMLKPKLNKLFTQTQSYDKSNNGE